MEPEDIFLAIIVGAFAVGAALWIIIMFIRMALA